MNGIEIRIFIWRFVLFCFRKKRDKYTSWLYVEIKERDYERHVVGLF